MRTLVHDLRYACRTLRRSRAYSATALAVLALGIGANTTIYSVVRGLALRPLPFEQPEQLVFIGEAGPGGRREPVAPANLVDLARQSRTLERIAMHRGARLILAGRTLPESVTGANVSSTFFDVLGVKAALGRGFLSHDEQPGGVRTAILSHIGWTRLFSSDPAIVGRTILLDGVEHVVAGVLPAGFSLWDTEIWVAGFAPDFLNSRGSRNAGAIGRLAAGVTLEQARAELDTIGRRLALSYPQTNAGWTFRTTSLQQAWMGDYRPTAFMLLAAVALVLIIACSNLASLLFERALARDREVAIRLALGAGRRRIVQQMLTESMLLGVLGGAAGVLVAYWLLGLVVAAMPSNTLTQIPGGAASIRLDLHTLAVAFVVSLLTGVIFGLVPAIRMARAGAEGALRGTARNAAGGRPRHVSRRALVVTQVALSAVLLIGAALMIRSVLNLHGLDRGYREDNALSLSLLLPQTRLPEASRRQQFFETVIERLRVLPGVTDVGGVTLLSSRGRPFAADGQAASAGLAPTAVFRAASPDYLRAIGIPLARGRHFTAADDSAAPAVAIVNETLTRSVWPDVDPIGQRLRLLDSDVDVVLTVVGVAGDVKESLDPRYPLRLDPRPTIYRPAAQQAIVSMTLIVRTGPDPLSLAAAVRREIAAVDSSIPVLALRSVRQGVMESIATPRFNAALLLCFAAIALLLASVGLYGVVACGVKQRTHEIGIRMALGAAPGTVWRAVVGEGLVLGVIGVAVGTAGAFGAVRLIASYLYGVRPTDPLTFIVVAGVLLAVAVLASYVPARRAASLDPLTALRHD